MDDSPITFRFADVDADTRMAYESYCKVQLAAARAASEAEQTKQLVEKNRHLEVEHAAEPARIVNLAQAEADARKIRSAAEIADMEARVVILGKVLDVVWPRLEALGAGFVGLIREENQATRDILVANMHLLAGRNPKDGQK